METAVYSHYFSLASGHKPPRQKPRTKPPDKYPLSVKYEIQVHFLKNISLPF